MSEEATTLKEAAIFLGAATAVVPLARWLGFGAVLGYLAAGIVIGPWCLRLIPYVDDVLNFAEIGVVFLLFVIGLELQPTRLWVMRRLLLGLGSTQVVATGSAFAVVSWALGLSWQVAFVVGVGFAMSSTAFGLQLLAEKKALFTRHGRAAFSVLLFQDLAVIPVLALLPALAARGMTSAGILAWIEMGGALLAVAGFVVGGHYLLRPLFRVIAATQIHEIFTAAGLLLIISAALLMDSAGLSMGLGAFLAGLLVADSEFRHQIEADIEPFKGLLLGLFFIAVGMSANLGLLYEDPVGVLVWTLGLIITKLIVLYVLACLHGLKRHDRWSLAVVLAPGGEFAFVLFSAAATYELLPRVLAEKLILAVTLSMAMMPFLYLMKEKLLSRLGEGDTRPFDVIEDANHAVVIAGFGRFGQIIARILTAQRIPFTALEVSPAQVDFVRKYGNKIYYGDAARLDLLRAAHVDKAKIFVLAVDDVESSVRIAETVTRHFPSIALYARARNRQHGLKLMDIGATAIIRDTLLSSIHLGGEVLRGLGFSAEAAAQVTALFRRHDQATFEQQYAIRNDEDALIQSAKDSARQLKALFESDIRVSSESEREPV